MLILSARLHRGGEDGRLARRGHLRRLHWRLPGNLGDRSRSLRGDDRTRSNPRGGFETAPV